MSTHRVAWLSAVILTTAVGAAGTAAMMPRERAMATIVIMALSGGALGVAFACQVNADLWRGARNGAMLAPASIPLSLAGSAPKAYPRVSDGCRDIPD